MNVQIAKRLLDKEKIKVIHTENGKIGVEKFVQPNLGFYDAILMDIRMPEMNGLESTKAIRALERADAKTFPIIAMTANAFDDEECIDVGMNAHLAKPIEPNTVYQALGSYLKYTLKEMGSCLINCW